MGTNLLHDQEEIGWEAVSLESMSDNQIWKLHYTGMFGAHKVEIPADGWVSWPTASSLTRLLIFLFYWYQFSFVFFSGAPRDVKNFSPLSVYFHEEKARRIFCFSSSVGFEKKKLKKKQKQNALLLPSHFEHRKWNCKIYWCAKAHQWNKGKDDAKRRRETKIQKSFFRVSLISMKNLKRISSPIAYLAKWFKITKSANCFTWQRIFFITLQI